tara:strand:- start:87 stop:587 length:501 start_codon:yes stop_codon:yes gene_type:complete
MLGLGIGIEHQDDTRLHVGMDHQGGIIFYLDGNGGGFICTAANVGTHVVWGCAGSVITGADLPSLGAGAQNTIDILAECTTADIAADLCRDLSLNGYSDWFLPSKNELDAMHSNLHEEGLGGFATNYHWSSTEYNNYNAWSQHFGDGSQGYSGKINSLYVRAVRAF